MFAKQLVHASRPSTALLEPETSLIDTDAVSNGIARVTITYLHEMLTPVGIFFPGGLNLSRQAEMRIE